MHLCSIIGSLCTLILAGESIRRKAVEIEREGEKEKVIATDCKPCLCFCWQLLVVSMSVRPI